MLKTADSGRMEAARNIAKLIGKARHQFEGAVYGESLPACDEEVRLKYWHRLQTQQSNIAMCRSDADSET